MEKEIVNQVQKAERVLYRISPRRNMPRHILIKLTKTKHKERHYIMIKGSIQEDITTINKYAPNIRALQYVRQMLTSMKGEINSNTIIV